MQKQLMFSLLDALDKAESELNGEQPTEKPKRRKTSKPRKVTATETDDMAGLCHTCTRGDGFTLKVVDHVLHRTCEHCNAVYCPETSEIIEEGNSHANE